MRYLLEFVSCCATPPIRERESSVPAEHEDRWLVPAPVVASSTASASSSSNRRYRKKRRNSGSLDWRPSLGPISEDVVVPPKGAVVASAGKEGKKKTANRGAGKVYHRSYSDGHHGPMIMPAFSATPFMF